MEAPGKDPRLVLDSTICQVNPNCSLPEAVQLPTVSDVCFSFQPSDPHSMWIGASLDFKAAHKQVKVRPKDQGLLLFEFQSKLYGYVVCHFGARFSAYWWQRLGALLLRIARSRLASQPHKAWLYVDDLLAALLRSSGDLQLGLLVTLFVCLKSPISWKKAALGDSLIWCGWKFNFRSETVRLEPDKLLKLAQQIQALLAAKKVTKKALQSCLGLLNWATSISLHLRSYTAPLYSDLHSPPGTLHNIPPRMWQRFLFSLDSKAVVTKPLPGLHISTSARIIEVGSIKVRRKSDVPLLPNSDRLTWVRVADPSASEISLTKDSKDCLAWLLSCVQATPTKPLADPHLLNCLSAADAMAEGDTVGIGGWLCTKDGLHAGGQSPLATASQGSPAIHSLLRNSSPASPASDGTQQARPSLPLICHARRLRQYAHGGGSQQALLNSLAAQPFPSPGSLLVACTLGLALGLPRLREEERVGR